MPVRIVTDSTCDLPRSIVERYGITVVPLSIFFGDEQLLDGVDISANEFYERLRGAHELPRTSQPSAERFRETYEAVAQESEEIVSIHLSSRLSGTLNSASVAREAVSHELRIELIDSYNVSLGLGAIVYEAAIVASEGGTMEQVIAAARSAMDRVHVVAVLDTLEYLRRGGRIGRAQSLLGSLLSIKPLVEVRDGEVQPFDRVRTRSKALDRLFEVALADRNPLRLWVGAAGDDASAEELLERLRPELPHTELLMAEFGPTVGVHTGPGMLGVCPVRRA
jgi:DegV family protein with EDD domain